jgi:hypothetical protein
VALALAAFVFYIAMVDNSFKPTASPWPRLRDERVEYRPATATTTTTTTPAAHAVKPREFRDSKGRGFDIFRPSLHPQARPAASLLGPPEGWVEVLKVGVIVVIAHA